MKFWWAAQQPCRVEADLRILSAECFFVKWWPCLDAPKHQYVSRTYARIYLYEAELSPAESIADGGERRYSQQEVQAKSQDAGRVEGVIDPGRAGVKLRRFVIFGLWKKSTRDVRVKFMPIVIGAVSYICPDS